MPMDCYDSCCWCCCCAVYYPSGSQTWGRHIVWGPQLISFLFNIGSLTKQLGLFCSQEWTLVLPQLNSTRWLPTQSLFSWEYRCQGLAWDSSKVLTCTSCSVVCLETRQHTGFDCFYQTMSAQSAHLILPADIRWIHHVVAPILLFDLPLFLH